MKTIIICSILVCLAGCVSRHPGTIALRPLPAASVSDDKSFRYPETLRAYHIGRYVDPNNSLVMHETHTLYRVEQTATWNSRPAPERELLPVELKALSDPAHVPAPFSDEIICELNHQKEITQKVTTEANRLTSVLQHLGESLAETKTIAKENLALKQQLSGAEQRISALENELRHHNQAAGDGPSNAIFSPDP